MKTQGIQALEWLISEAEAGRSRDQGTVTVSGGVALPSGTTLGKLANGKYVPYNNAAADGSNTVAAILGTPLDGVNGDYPALLFNDDCQVDGDMLNGGAGVDAAGIVDLRALSIKVR